MMNHLIWGHVVRKMITGLSFIFIQKRLLFSAVWMEFLREHTYNGEKEEYAWSRVIIHNIPWWMHELQERKLHTMHTEIQVVMSERETKVVMGQGRLPCCCECCLLTGGYMKVHHDKLWSCPSLVNFSKGIFHNIMA